MKIILLGPPGAGKGTQADFIQKQFGFLSLSTGNILRMAIRDQTPLGKTAKTAIDEGKLVADRIIIDLMLDKIEEFTQKNILLDGFPRNLAQAQAIKEKGIIIDHVIEIAVPYEQIVKRLSGRRIHEASGRTYHIFFNPPKITNKDDLTGETLIQRDDDEEDTVKKRLTVYQEETYTLTSFYQQIVPAGTTRYHKIDGMQPIEKVSQTIDQILSHLQ